MCFSSPALKSADNEYLFQNGFNGTSFDIAGTTFIYQIMDNATEGYTEELSAIGPLTAAIKVEVRNIYTLQGCRKVVKSGEAIFRITLY